MGTSTSSANDQLSPQNRADLASARKATARFNRVEQAEAEGYINLDFCEEGEGCHWLNLSLLDGEFDATRPEILRFVITWTSLPQHAATIPGQWVSIKI